MASAKHVMPVTILLLILHQALTDRSDHRWRHVPLRQYNLISGQDCTLVWSFKLPSEDRNIFMTVTHFRDDIAEGMTIASLTVKPSNRNPIRMETYNNKQNITANYRAGTVTITVYKLTPEESGDIYIHIDMPPIPLTALTHIKVYEDKRWRYIPYAEYDVIVGQNKTFTWQFVPRTKGEFCITIIQDKVTYGMSVATEMIRATDTEPVQLRIYADYRGRVTARYIPESGTIHMTVLQWTLEDTGEIFVQVDTPPVPLTASTYIKVFDVPRWISDIREQIRIPESCYKSIEFSRSHSKLSPAVLNVTVEFKPQNLSGSPLAVTILPMKNGFHMKHSDHSLSGMVYLSADPILEDISIQILNMSQAHVGKYDVTFHFNISGVSLHTSFHLLLQETTLKHEESSRPELSVDHTVPGVREIPNPQKRKWQLHIPYIIGIVTSLLSLTLAFTIGFIKYRRKQSLLPKTALDNSAPCMLSKTAIDNSAPCNEASSGIGTYVLTEHFFTSENRVNTEDIPVTEISLEMESIDDTGYMVDTESIGDTVYMVDTESIDDSGYMVDTGYIFDTGYMSDTVYMSDTEGIVDKEIIIDTERQAVKKNHQKKV